MFRSKSVSFYTTQVWLGNTALFLLIMVFSPVLAMAQPAVVGAWKLDLQHTLSLMDPAFQEQYNNLPPDVKAQLNASMEERNIIFKPTGEVQVHWKFLEGQRVSTGHWERQQVQNLLHMTIDGVAVRYRYEQPKANVLVLRNLVSGGYFDNLYFTRHTTKN